MKLSAEQRKKIYEEEKARIEAEEKQRMSAESSLPDIKSNVAGLLCYVAGWISGIIFLVIEQKNALVRFHAMQATFTFGVLTIATILLGLIPVVGPYFSSILGILMFIVWIVLMVKAYLGELYKLPVAGNIAMEILAALERGGKPDSPPEQAIEESSSTSTGESGNTEIREKTSITSSEKVKEQDKSSDSYFHNSRAGRIAGYSGAIFWGLLLIILFCFFYQYIAWYSVASDGHVVRIPLLTARYFIWLPILVFVLVLSIAGNIVLIIHDRYWLHQVIKIALNIFGIITIANLISIFPFDFGAIPNNAFVYVMPVIVKIVLVIIAVGLAVEALLRFIRLLVHFTGKRNS